MEKLSIILSSLSALTVLIAILYEGQFKNNSKNGSVIAKITKTGWVLIGLSILMGFGNGFTNYKNIVDNDIKYKKDSTKMSNSNILLRKKSITDSLVINDLLKLSKVNILKSDSIKFSVVDNAVKALDEQRLMIERANDNIYIHLKKEFRRNLSLILYNFEESKIREFEDTTMFTLYRLDDTYIKKYEAITGNKLIIEKFMNISEKIKSMNYFADDLLRQREKHIRKFNIDSFLDIKNEIYNHLISVYAEISNVKSYKQFESLKLFSRTIKYNRQQLKDSLLIETQYMLYDKIQ